MTKLKCPKGHDLKYFTTDCFYTQLKIRWCKECQPAKGWLSRPYLEMDCIDSNSVQLPQVKKDNNQVNTQTIEEPINESPITSDKDGWIDFEKKNPEIGQLIFSKWNLFDEEPIINEGYYGGIIDNEHYIINNYVDKKCKYNFHFWKPANPIADAIKKVEYCQCDEPLGNAKHCTVHHDQECSDGIGCKIQSYCAYCMETVSDTTDHLPDTGKMVNYSAEDIFNRLMPGIKKEWHTFEDKIPEIGQCFDYNIGKGPLVSTQRSYYKKDMNDWKGKGYLWRLSKDQKSLSFNHYSGKIINTKCEHDWILQSSFTQGKGRLPNNIKTFYKCKLCNIEEPIPNSQINNKDYGIKNDDNKLTRLEKMFGLHTESKCSCIDKVIEAFELIYKKYIPIDDAQTILFKVAKELKELKDK